MADRPNETKTFAQFLEEQPAPAETVTLTGYAARSARAGSFSFTTGGQTLELPTEAVKSHKVVSEGAERLVELEIVTSKLDPKIVKLVVADGFTNPIADRHTIKEVITDHVSDKFIHKDPIQDPVTLPETYVPDPGPLAVDPAVAAQPFVLATPHHAPAATIAAQMGGGQTAAQFATTPVRDLITLAHYDRLYTWKELIKDPLMDLYTLPETVIPDPTNTAAEGIGVQTGGGQVVNPAMQAQAMQAQAMQGQASQAQMYRFTTPLTDVATVAALDHYHTLPWLDYHTIKEVVKDPITDVYTLPENLPGGGGGTLQEGVAGGGPVVNPVWNLPGMMF